MKFIQVLFSLLLMSLFSTAMAGDIDAMMADCNGCHGDKGVSQWNDVPTIAGIDAFGHADALFMFRDEERPCSESKYRQGDTSRAATTMCAIAAELSDDDIEALGDAYSALPFVPAAQKFDAALAEAGAAVHEKLCEQCHSEGGSNAEDEASILAGQWAGYLEAEFASYLSGDRPQDKKMKEKMDALSEDDAKALIHYYASQQ
jgi:sulfide dehydrogenase cytochrome subunit